MKAEDSVSGPIKSAVRDNEATSMIELKKLHRFIIHNFLIINEARLPSVDLLEFVIIKEFSW